MRVIAGQFRGRTLVAPPGLRLRPTSDALRETLFNILAAKVPGAVFVDACAGTGAVGIEALSRGAAEAVFIEPSRPALDALRANLSRLPAAPAEIIARPLPGALARLARPADLLFLDPPYTAAEVYEATLEALGMERAPEVLQPEAWVVAEHARRWDLAAIYGRLHRFRVVTQGDSQLSFYAIAAAAFVNRAGKK